MAVIVDFKGDFMASNCLMGLVIVQQAVVEAVLKIFKSVSRMPVIVNEELSILITSPSYLLHLNIYSGVMGVLRGVQ